MTESPCLANVQVVALAPDIEEEVIIRTDGLELVVFAHVCPYRIRVGEHHLVDLSLEVLDEDEEDVQIAADEPESVQRIEHFRYRFVGTIAAGEMLSVNGVCFDASGAVDSALPAGTRISIVVDRISAAFIRPEPS